MAISKRLERTGIIQTGNQMHHINRADGQLSSVSVLMSSPIKGKAKNEGLKQKEANGSSCCYLRSNDGAGQSPYCSSKNKKEAAY